MIVSIHGNSETLQFDYRINNKLGETEAATDCMKSYRGLFEDKMDTIILESSQWGICGAGKKRQDRD